MTPAAAAARRAVQSRNATEEAILDAAREALAEKGFDGLTMDAIARKAFVSRTAVYFYFPNKRAVVDRLIQHAFSEMYVAASPYLDGDGDPRKELRAGLARGVEDRLLGGVARLHGAPRRRGRRCHRAASSANAMRSRVSYGSMISSMKPRDAATATGS